MESQCRQKTDSSHLSRPRSRCSSFNTSVLSLSLHTHTLSLFNIIISSHMWLIKHSLFNKYHWEYKWEMFSSAALYWLQTTSNTTEVSFFFLSLFFLFFFMSSKIAVCINRKRILYDNSSKVDLVLNRFMPARIKHDFIFNSMKNGIKWK